jgi:hypothetical protein
MKRISTALVVTALLALGACGSRTANNTTAIDTSNDVYNVSPDDLTANDLGGNASGNASSSGNSSSGSSSNSATSNASGNSH